MIIMNESVHYYKCYRQPHVMVEIITGSVQFILIVLPSQSIIVLLVLICNPQQGEGVRLHHLLHNWLVHLSGVHHNTTGNFLIMYLIYSWR